MKDYQLTNQHLLGAQMVTEVLEAYANDGTQEFEVPAKMMAAVSSGYEGPLINTGWSKMPNDYRLALVEVVSNIEGLAWGWRRDFRVDFIRQTIETARLLIQILRTGTSVTISLPSEDYVPTVSIRASGYGSKIVTLGSALLALTSMGLVTPQATEEIYLHT